jgi:hypothetical protein
MSNAAFNSYGLAGGALGGIGYCIAYQGLGATQVGAAMGMCAVIGLVSAYVLDMANAQLMGSSSAIPVMGMSTGTTPALVGVVYGGLGSALYNYVM